MRCDKGTGQAYCADGIESGQLWRRRANDATHRVTAFVRGHVWTRSVDGGFRGPAADFEADFERVLDQAEKEALQPARIERRRVGR